GEAKLTKRSSRSAAKANPLRQLSAACATRRGARSGDASHRRAESPRSCRRQAARPAAISENPWRVRGESEILGSTRHRRVELGEVHARSLRLRDRDILDEWIRSIARRMRSATANEGR